MSRSNKRTHADAGLNLSESSKKARKTQFAASLPPTPESASRTSQSLSSPTLVGSVPTSPPEQPPSSSVSSVINAGNTSSSNASSLDQPSPHPLTDWTTSSSTHGTESVSPSDASTLDQPSPPHQYCSTCSSTHGTESISPSDASTLDQPSNNPASPNPNPDIRRPLSIRNRLSESSSASTSDTETSLDSTTSDEASESSSSNHHGSDDSTDSSSGFSDGPSPPRTNTRVTTSTLTAKNLSTLPLLDRLESLLPKLQSANEQLEVERREGRLGERDIENVKEEDGEEDGKGIIEMDLGLGVLEEKKKKQRRRQRTEEMKRETVSRSGSGSGSDRERSDGGENTAAGGKEDALATMMGIGRPKGKRKVKIEEV